ncbi:MAG: STAS domain-containing protein [Candidatus Omnitrophica bacterium]|nr:STAS domain-containing protein [Candidatus Omnitrophota bacterium]
MNIHQEKLNDVVLCSVNGEININNSPELRKAFDELIKKSEKKVLIDFSTVSYVDSSGLATLIEMFQRLKKIGGHLRFCNMDQKIKNLFEITKLCKLFEIFDTRESALKGF